MRGDVLGAVSRYPVAIFSVKPYGPVVETCKYIVGLVLSFLVSVTYLALDAQGAPQVQDCRELYTPTCLNVLGFGYQAEESLMQPICKAPNSALVIDGANNFRLGCLHYLTRPSGYKRYCPTINGAGKGDESSLATCFQVQKSRIIDADYLKTWRANILDQDDVFNPVFLQEVIFGGTENVHLESDTKTVFEAWNTHRVSFVPEMSNISGPCYVYKDDIQTVWRVYQDRQLAFVQATWPSVEDVSSHVEINAAGNGYRGHGIAVPARSLAQNFRSSIERDCDKSATPLKGLRVALKDNYHLRGVRTSLGNRAYYESHPIQKASAAIVPLLNDAGAHIVGKAHLSSFAMMEHPTQSVDYQAPFNPRGDGYLITGGSSGGNAAAIAAYDWLDVSVCSDTTGSARIPALQNGVFGFRPSTHSISTEGLVKDWAAVDTPALIGRDVTMFPKVLEVLQLEKPKVLRLKKPAREILYPTDFIPEDSPEQVSAMETFIGQLSQAANCTHRKISIHEDWQQAGPVPERDLRKYLFNLTRHGWFYSANHNFEGFRRQYSSDYGHAPFVTEVVRWYWYLGGQVTSDQHAEMIERLSIFKDWFLHQYGLEGSSNNVMAIHIDKIRPKYRDEYPGNDNPEVPGLRATYLAAILGAPELAIPITQLPYQSRITGKEEKLPMVVSLMGAPYSDMQLLDWTIEALRKCNRPTKVKTGKLAFD